MKKKEEKNDYFYNVLVPTVIENTNRGERAYDIYSRLLKDRIVVIHNEIEFGLAGLIIAQLLYLEKEDKNKDIYLYINSPGGSVSEGLAIFDVMNHISCDVVTIGMGLCASMGAFLLAGGTKGKRYVLPNTKVMIHQPWGGVEGQATDILIKAEQIKKVKDLIIDYMSQFTGQPRDKIQQDIERDFWLDAYESANYGIVDKVLNPTKKSNYWEHPYAKNKPKTSNKKSN